MASQPTAIVTGGAKRIGRAIVEDLAAQGWAVAIHHNRSRDEAEALADAINAKGGRATAIGADLSDLWTARGVVMAAAGELGPVDVLVNCAAIFERDSFGDLDRDLWARQMTVNLAAPIFLAEAFVAGLPEDREGNIINVVDQRVWKPVPDFFSYQLSKSALWTATQTMAQALAPRVRVNAIGPGPMLPSVRMKDEDFRRQVEALPLQRGAELSEVGRTVRFLVETPSITGQMIALDGGQHLAWKTPDVTGINE